MTLEPNLEPKTIPETILKTMLETIPETTNFFFYFLMQRGVPTLAWWPTLVGGTYPGGRIPTLVGVPTMVGGWGYLPWWESTYPGGGTYHGRKVPTLVGGTYSGGGYLPWWGVPTLVGVPTLGLADGYLPAWGIGYIYLPASPSQHQGRYYPIQGRYLWLGYVPRPG